MTVIAAEKVPAIERDRAGERRLLLVSTVAGHAFKHLLSASLYVMIPEIKTTLGLSNAEVGLLSSVRNLTSGVVNIPAGFVADRYPQRCAAFLGIILLSIGIALAVASTFAAYSIIMLALAVFAGFVSFWHPPALGALSREYSDRRGFAISWHGTGGSIGEAFGPLIAGLLLGVFSWQVIFRGSLLPAAIAGAAIWFALRSVPLTNGEPLGFGRYVRGVGTLLSNRQLVLVLAFAGLFTAAQVTITTFLPIYLRESVGLTTASVGFYLFLAQVIGIGAQPVMGHLSDRFGRRSVLVPALFFLGASDVALYFTPAGLPFMIVVAAMGAFLYSLMAIFIASAADLVHGSVQATAVSLIFGIATIMAGIGPGIAGLLADAYGVQMTFIYAGAIVLATGLLAVTTRWTKTTLEVN